MNNSVDIPDHTGYAGERISFLVEPFSIVGGRGGGGGGGWWWWWWASVWAFSGPETDLEAVGGENFLNRIPSRTWIGDSKSRHKTKAKAKVFKMWLKVQLN